MLSISHLVQSVIKKGMPPGSGLSSVPENDETCTQSDVGQVTGTTSPVTMLLLLLTQFLIIIDVSSIVKYILHKKDV